MALDLSGIASIMTLLHGMFHRNIAYPELEKTHKDHQVQLLDLMYIVSYVYLRRNTVVH